MSEKSLTIKSLLAHDLHEYERFSMMLSKTVHDINNPLAVFIGQLSIIELMQQRDQLTPEKLELILSKFKSSSQTFKERLDQLRAFYKIPVNSDQFDQAHQILNSILYYFENELYTRNISIEHICPENINLKLPPNEFFLVLKHLIQNSIEAISETKPTEPKISVECLELDEHLEVSIFDNGGGLLGPYEMAVELGYTTKGNKHAGTGLALTQHILDQYKIKLEYQCDASTQFKFLIPKK